MSDSPHDDRESGPQTGRFRRKWQRWGFPVLMAAVCFAALGLLRRELREYGPADIVAGFRMIPLSSLGFAVALTVLNYLILVGYDLLGTRYIRHPLETRRVALASFLGHAVGNSLGALLGGAAVRYRLYSAWGLSGREIVKLVLLLSVTFWIGLFGLAGLAFLVAPTPVPERLKIPWESTFPLGLLLSGVALVYFLICVFRERVTVGRFRFSPPPWRLAILQFLIASLDLAVAAGVLYVLLPASVPVSFFHFLPVYLLALVGVFIAQVPGGLGVLELVLLFLLDTARPDQLMGSLIAYRLVYFLLPLVVGLVVIAIHECRGCFRER